MYRNLVRAIFFTILISFTACSTPQLDSQKNSERYPSSEYSQESDDIKKLEVSYQYILNSRQPGQEMAQMIQRLSKIYYRATGLIQQFDQEIGESAKNVELGALPDQAAVVTSDVYAQIQAAKLLMDQIETKILYYFRRINEDRSEAIKSSKGSTASVAAARLSEIRKEMNNVLKEQSTGPGVFALDHLFKNLAEQHLSFIADAKKRHDPDLTKNDDSDIIRSRIITTFEKAKELHKKHAAQIRNRTIEASVDKQINETIIQEAEVIQNDFSYQFEGQSSERIPAAQNSKKMYPSSTSAGNIIGGFFPAKTWVLTIDDGPHPTRSIEIMKILENNDYRGTFFWLGKALGNSYAAKVVEYAKANGHELANHSQTHPNFRKVSPSEMQSAIRNEIIKPTQTMTSMYGYKPKFYRCPYGGCNKIAAIRKAIADEGFLHAFWAVDSLDWNQAANPNGASDIAKRVRNQMSSVGKGVILFHDVQPHTASAFKILMSHFKNMEKSGHRFVSFCQAVDEGNGEKSEPFCSK